MFYKCLFWLIIAMPTFFRITCFSDVFERRLFWVEKEARNAKSIQEIILIKMNECMLLTFLSYVFMNFEVNILFFASQNIVNI